MIPAFVLSKIQEGGSVIMLGKWWQVLLILIASIVGAVLFEGTDAFRSYSQTGSDIAR